MTRLGLTSDYDIHILTSFDGAKKFRFPDGDQVFTAYGNYGMPPVEYLTRQGYKQDGATVIDYRINPRTINITLARSGRCTRKKYWEYREALIDFMRPNRGGAMTLELRKAGGVRRALKVFPEPGPTFAPTPPTKNNFDIDEALTFIAFDPIWYDPTTVTVSATSATASQLVFPITFPITFDADAIGFTRTINYTGTWKTYPVITITGPYTSAVVQNQTTGAYLTLNIPIGTEQRIITLTPGAQSIKDASGNDKFGELAPESNLVGLAIFPSPEVANGTNVISASLPGAVLGTSAVSVSYNTRYIGI